MTFYLISSILKTIEKQAPLYRLEYTVAYDTDAGSLVYNGSGGTAVGGGPGFAAGNAAGFQTALNTALGTEAVPSALGRVEDTGTAFKVTIVSAGDADVLTLGGNTGAKTGATIGFITKPTAATVTVQEA